MGFITDLQRGNTGEKLVIDLFDKSGFNVEKELCQLNKCDLNITGNINNEFLQFTVEVKTDFYEAKSGNIAIETHNTKLEKPSGINSTQADLWCHVLQSSIWIANSHNLREFVHNVAPCRLISCGGDDNAQLFLYSRDIILPMVFRRIDDLLPNELQELVIELL